MADGQLAMNTNLASPGLFFKDSNGDLVKTGPVHVGTTAPNATPASGGQAGNSKGELWLDTTGTDYTLKTWDGTAWREIVVTSTMIKDGTIVNADVNASAAIAGTKVAPDFGSQNVVTTGTATAASLNPTGSSVPANGVYLPATNSVAIATNSTHRVRIDSSGNVGIGTTSPAAPLHVAGNIQSGIAGIDGSITLNRAEDGQPINAISYNGVTEEMRLNNGSGNGRIVFQTVSTERARIDSSGRLLVGTSTSTQNIREAQKVSVVTTGTDQVGGISLVNYGGSNPVIRSIFDFKRSRGTTDGSMTAVASGDDLGLVSFFGSDGTNFIESAVINALVDGATGANSVPGRLSFGTTPSGSTLPVERMSINSIGDVSFAGVGGVDQVRIWGGTGHNVYADNRCGIHFGTTILYPTNGGGTINDNAVSLGIGSNRWSVVYAGTGTINTSDANQKQDLEALSQSELQVASAIKQLIKKFRFKDAVEAKGDEARIHIGVIAQEIEQAFIDADLNPRSYGMFCEDTLEDGTKRLGIRYDELLAFVIAAL
jgi:putative component of toxin-antitoxin plasmid stabilization module